MGAKLAVAVVFALLGAGALLNLSSGPAPRGRSQPSPAAQKPPSLPARVQPPPPMFSPWYAEALNGVLDLGESGVARLEERLAADANDLPARLHLMAYHHRADRAANPDDRAKRLRHTLWLIEHHPESEILHSYVAQFEPGQIGAADYRRAISLWEAAVAARPGSAPVLWNAANFFAGLDPALHLHYLEATAAADPNHPHALRPLAHLYARSIAAGDSLAGHARAALEASNNVWVVGNAAHYLQMVYNQSVQTGAPVARLAESAERYLLRAQALDPNLDRRTILPQIDLDAIRRAQADTADLSRKLAAHTEEGVRAMRRLPVDAFPELPPAVAGALKARSCTVPQPEPPVRPVNVIRGEFIASGQKGWAVLCSVNRRSELLVFRHDADTDPVTVTATDDVGHFQGLGGDKVGYSRQITAVDRAYILRHYRAYGGPAPPPILHHAIDDAFIGKASVVWYLHQGKWITLRGAD